MPVPTLLLVDDDPRSLKLLARVLSGLGHVRLATNGADAMRIARESPPDLILLDAQMPGITGFQVCEALKADEALAPVPVIFVTSHSEPEFEITGFEAGAVDYIAKPVSAELLLARVKAQLRAKFAADDVRQLGLIDALTGVANRRSFDESMSREWRRARRNAHAIALLMVDVDHFKLFNDRYGHPAGDVCLRTVARALVRAGHRPADLVARYGGEEFVLILPQTSAHGAAHMARTVLETVAGLGIAHATSPTAPHVTVSVGVGTYDEGSAQWSDRGADSRFGTEMLEPCSDRELLVAADKALYAAKAAGRAQAHRLDIANASRPELARRISSPSSSKFGPLGA